MYEVQCDEQWSFMRAFSALGQLQQEYAIRYSCKRFGAKAYQFTLIRQCAKNIKEESTIVREIDSVQAHQLIQYLYENAVPFENWKDILLDLREILQGG